MKLSVIVPSYNRASLLASSVESICSIAHRPLEIVVVDDGSTDDTPAQEEQIRTNCGERQVELQWIRQDNAGAAAARNTGLSACTGELVQWVDADDTVDPAGVGALIAVMAERADLDVTYGLVRVVAPNGAVEGVMGRAPSNSDADYFDYLWHTMGAVYRRRCVAIPGPWNPLLTMPDDWDFSSRIRISGVSFLFVDVIVGSYHKYETGTLTITGFHETKCFNVIEAVLSIRGALMTAGKYSRSLQQRCFNRAFVHAVELAAHGSRLAGLAFGICNDIGSPDLRLRLGARALALLRVPALHRPVFRLIRRDLRGKARTVEEAPRAPSNVVFAGQMRDEEASAVSPEIGALGLAGAALAKLSVVCPTHNRAGFLNECVTSVLEGASGDWELIVVDDASSDETPRVMEDLMARFPQGSLRYLRQPGRMGAPAARNRGIREARGNYIMFIDSDDVACADGIAKLVAALDGGGLDFAYGRVAQTDISRTRVPGLGDIGTPFSPDAPDITALSWHTMGAVYERRFLLEKVGLWNEALEGSQDWEFQARVKLAQGRVAALVCLVGYWRQHDQGRIGGSVYKPSYVNSVMLAALAIEKAAADHGRLTNELRRVLCHRLVNHQLEAAAHGNSEQAQTIAREAQRLSRGLFPEGLLVPALSWTPGQWADKALFDFVRGHRWRPARR